MGLYYKGKGISKVCIKNIAIAFMLIDHLGFMLLRYVQGNVHGGQFYNNIFMGFRLVGRSAFILFAYITADSMRKTSNRLKYLFRLFCLAICSEVFFDLFNYGRYFYTYYQNVIFTLLTGALLIYIKDLLKDKKALFFLLFILVGMVPSLIHADYGLAGVAMIVTMYIYFDDYYKLVAYSFVSFIVCYIISSLFIWNHIRVSADVFMKSAGTIISTEIFGLLGFLIIRFYNGKKGNQMGRWFYYLFYPLHLLIIYIIGCICNNVLL